MLKIAEYRFWVIVACLIAVCLASAPLKVLKTGSSVDIEVASKKIYFSYATTGHHPFFSCAKDQTRPQEHHDDLPGILLDLGELASAREFYLLTHASCAYYTRFANRPIRAPPHLLS